MEGAEPSRKEGRGPRTSRSFSGVFGDFPGISKTTSKGLVEYGEEQEEESYGTEVVPLPVGKSKGTSEPNLASLISLSLISLYHIYWPS
ncbi:hypothetical protein O181_031868 [Austropuccinia psidii MF-1]|uniref:Uncharacterized protein n=1 Tax=Austropuccinia psidii MF-1 TaxID=1389203 RepID=A0A9Q3CYD1_9BASI|nr:hypothetical protein [Austropuccinia psidii MF-1]